MGNQNAIKLVLITAIGLVGGLFLFGILNGAGETPTPDATRPGDTGLPLEKIPFDGQRAYGYLKELCALGPRISGTPGMERQRELLTAHFRKLGGQVDLQSFRVRHPLDGKPVAMANLIVQWRPESTERILLCAHYDTRPLPDSDPDPVQRREGVFLGANDGASGTALLMEFGHRMAEYKGNLGVDFCFFDGEELVYDPQRDPLCLGSEWFARQYVASPPAHRYRWGVLLDMVGDSELNIHYEGNSYKLPATRPLVKQIWETAARLGVREFVPQVRHVLLDDHLPLNNRAHIPTCDIIDFDYPDNQNRYWHTTADIPENCSALSLAKVGWVVWEWLKTAE